MEPRLGAVKTEYQRTNSPVILKGTAFREVIDAELR